MADFTRFISYLYDYRNGERNRNLGFAKVEARQGMCRVGINLNHGQVLAQEMTLYGYLCEPDGVYLVPFGEMEKGSRERRWSFPLERLHGRGIRLENLSGLILLSKDRNSFLLSVWMDGPRSAEEIRQGKLWKQTPIQEMAGEVREEDPVEAPTGETPQELQAERDVELNQQDENHTRYQIDAENDRIAMENGLQPESRSAIPEKPEPMTPEENVSGSASWRNLCKLFPAARPFEPSAWEVLCISLQDIGRLPPENWVWGNNHFLLHGYYQYHHLILARQRNENKVYLGIPGEFGVNEKFMAAMFGLHQFQRERQGRSDKGYWLTPIRIN